jgi:hypothetical protein
MTCKTVLLAITLAIATALVGGCATLDAKRAGARTAIEAGTLQYIDGDRERAQRVYDVTTGLLEQLDTDSDRPVRQALDEIEQRARDRIQWSQLTDAEALVVHRVIDAARAEIEHRIQQGTMDESRRVAISTVLRWIRDIAQLSGAHDGSNLESLDSDAALAPRRARTT